MDTGIRIRALELAIDSASFAGETRTAAGVVADAEKFYTFMVPDDEPAVEGWLPSEAIMDESGPRTLDWYRAILDVEGEKPHKCAWRATYDSARAEGEACLDRHDCRTFAVEKATTRG